jgi:hypothetical protein
MLKVPDNPYINSDNSHIGNMAATDKTIPSTVNPRALPIPSSNVVAASGKWTGGGGGRVRRRRTKMSRKYMRRSRRSRRCPCPCHRRRRRRSSHRGGRRSRRRTAHRRRRTRRYSGGAGAIATAPAYPAGHTQFDSNKVWSNNYSTGGVHLAPHESALATPPPIQRLAPEVDNLNHNAANAYGHNVGSGFPSRGWF